MKTGDEIIPDVSEFIERLRTFERHSAPELRTFFDPESEIIIARAPGRLDVMGGIADYSGSLVLELPIAEATFVALQKDDTRRLRLISLLENGNTCSEFRNAAGRFRA